MNFIKFISKAGKAGGSNLKPGLKKALAIKSQKKKKVLHSKEYKDLSKQIKSLKTKNP